jgi:hypothetical protein
MHISWVLILKIMQVQAHRLQQMATQKLLHSMEGEVGVISREELKDVTISPHKQNTTFWWFLFAREADLL